MKHAEELVELAKAANGKPCPMGPTLPEDEVEAIEESTLPKAGSRGGRNQILLGYTLVDLGSPLGHRLRWVPDKEPAFKEVILPRDPWVCLGLFSLQNGKGTQVSWSLDFPGWVRILQHLSQKTRPPATYRQ